ncbi:hypothetical protein KFE25_006537 [Diacronema lutheri]|uniref:AP2/ERF domain-containing protein n=1 Tax=Diacronema lutheri TaxID=2081491 RepID=A0A8J6C1N7_DIALT|nr:hypothetical protein KFE25_006537 [Diacronema lutheri]
MSVGRGDEPQRGELVLVQRAAGPPVESILLACAGGGDEFVYVQPLGGGDSVSVRASAVSRLQQAASESVPRGLEPGARVVILATSVHAAPSDGSVLDVRTSVGEADEALRFQVLLESGAADWYTLEQLRPAKRGRADVVDCDSSIDERLLGDHVSPAAVDARPAALAACACAGGVAERQSAPCCGGGGGAARAVSDGVGNNGCKVPSMASGAPPLAAAPMPPRERCATCSHEFTRADVVAPDGQLLLDCAVLRSSDELDDTLFCAQCARPLLRAVTSEHALASALGALGLELTEAARVDYPSPPAHAPADVAKRLGAADGAAGALASRAMDCNVPAGAPSLYPLPATRAPATQLEIAAAVRVAHGGGAAGSSVENATCVGPHAVTRGAWPPRALANIVAAAAAPASAAPLPPSPSSSSRWLALRLSPSIGPGARATFSLDGGRSAFELDAPADYSAGELLCVELGAAEAKVRTPPSPCAGDDGDGDVQPDAGAPVAARGADDGPCAVGALAGERDAPGSPSPLDPNKSDGAATIVTVAPPAVLPRPIVKVARSDATHAPPVSRRRVISSNLVHWLTSLKEGETCPELIVSHKTESGYKGVTRCQPLGKRGRHKWQAQMCISARVIHLGSYEDPKTAAQAYTLAQHRVRTLSDQEISQLLPPSLTTARNAQLQLAQQQRAAATRHMPMCATQMRAMAAAHGVGAMGPTGCCPAGSWMCCCCNAPPSHAGRSHYHPAGSMGAYAQPADAHAYAQPADAHAFGGHHGAPGGHVGAHCGPPPLHLACMPPHGTHAADAAAAAAAAQHGGYAPTTHSIFIPAPPGGFAHYAASYCAGGAYAPGPTHQPPPDCYYTGPTSCYGSAAAAGAAPAVGYDRVPPPGCDADMRSCGAHGAAGSYCMDVHAPQPVAGLGLHVPAPLAVRAQPSQMSVHASPPPLPPPPPQQQPPAQPAQPVQQQTSPYEYYWGSTQTQQPPPSHDHTRAQGDDCT